MKVMRLTAVWLRHSCVGGLLQAFESLYLRRESSVKYGTRGNTHSVMGKGDSKGPRATPFLSLGALKSAYGSREGMVLLPAQHGYLYLGKGSSEEVDALIHGGRRKARCKDNRMEFGGSVVLSKYTLV